MAAKHGLLSGSGNQTMLEAETFPGITGAGNSLPPQALGVRRRPGEGNTMAVEEMGM